jgi:hypothetical protein
MKVKVLVFTTIIMAAVWVVTIPVNSDQPLTAAGGAVQGRLELECNLSEVDLFLCPKENFSRKTNRAFFGLVKSQTDECSGDQFFLGTTPLKPVALPAGKFVLIIPLQFAGDHEGPVEILIQPEKKSFLMLKLFKKYSDPENPNPNSGDGGRDSSGSGAGGGNSGGSGSAGAVGTGAPNSP